MLRTRRAVFGPCVLPFARLPRGGGRISMDKKIVASLAIAALLALPAVAQDAATQTTTTSTTSSDTQNSDAQQSPAQRDANGNVVQMEQTPVFRVNVVERSL